MNSPERNYEKKEKKLITPGFLGQLCVGKFEIWGGSIDETEKADLARALSDSSIVDKIWEFWCALVKSGKQEPRCHRELSLLAVAGRAGEKHNKALPAEFLFYPVGMRGGDRTNIKEREKKLAVNCRRKKK